MIYLLSLLIYAINSNKNAKNTYPLTSELEIEWQ